MALIAENEDDTAPKRRREPILAYRPMERYDALTKPGGDQLISPASRLHNLNYRIA